MEKDNLEKCAACPFGPPAWRYKCGECANEFEMPSPSGPTEEKNRTCPRCKSQNIARIDIVKSEACPPGG
jgi:DNA-directed RNA polymerase subunit RPC12/RpoP